MGGCLDVRAHEKATKTNLIPISDPPRVVDDCMSVAFTWALGYYIRGMTTKNNRGCSCFQKIRSVDPLKNTRERKRYF